jgi:cell wall-associated NlpC family hydrolase
MPSIAEYVGLPFAPRGRTREGVDCWGLVCLVYREVLGRVLPSYDDRYQTLDAAERAHRDALIGEGRTQFTAVDVEQAFDLALFASGDVMAHIGLVVEPGRMLHIQRDRWSVLEDYRRPAWQRRLQGFWRC